MIRINRDTPYVLIDVDSATVVNAGDVVWLDTDDVKPAGDFTWDTDLTTTQAIFAGSFLGIALETSKAGETSKILVQTGGFFRMGLASGSYNLGAPLGCDKASGNALRSDQLESANASNSVFRVAESGTVQEGGKLLVEIFSAFRGQNVNAEVG